MVLCKWNELPENLRNEDVRPYYDLLKKKTFSLVVKRVLDVLFSFIILALIWPALLVIALLIKLDSKGPVFFRQTRVTTYGRLFKIHKFRTMSGDFDDELIFEDEAVTKLGKVLRKYRIDELPQLIDVFLGDMTFVGVRPEIPKYVSYYDDKMMATLLLPAGVTNIASIFFKDEDKLLKDAIDIDETYVNELLPRKMKWNLKGMRDFGIGYDFKVILATVLAIFGGKFKI